MPQALRRAILSGCNEQKSILAWTALEICFPLIPMKTLGLFIVGLALASPVLAQDRAQQVQSSYQQGLVAVRDGEVELARDAFKRVLELDPNNANAQFQLNQLSTSVGQLNLRKRELAFSRIVVPQVAFNATTFSDALAALASVVERESAGKFVPNFVLSDPSGELAKREISLDLRAVPAPAVLKYLCEQAGAVSRIESHAIVLRLPNTVSPSRSLAPAEGVREQALARIIVPKVGFSGATVRDALDALSLIVARESGNKFETNFVVTDPSGELAKREISLELQNVPANAVLRYICDLGAASYRLEEHAIVLRPLKTPAAAPVAVPAAEPVVAPAQQQP